MELLALETVAVAVVLGITSYILARALRIPAVLFYLMSGLVAGPMGLGLIDTSALGSGLLTLVEIAVAIILFEGGLSLSSHSFLTEATAIRRILLISLPITGIGAALLARTVLAVPWHFAIFFGALIVVTGPTVIGSLLKSVTLSRRLEVLLNWESIWGDVIGVLLSAVALELIVLAESETMGHLALNFALRLGYGVLLGGASGAFLARFVVPWVNRLRDPSLSGLVVVAGAIGTFTLANVLVDASGALAAAVAGFTLSYLGTEALHEIRHFKEQLSSLFISTLFVLLAAYIDPTACLDRWPQMLLIALVLGALVRPLSVLLALAASPVPWRERLFIGIIGPRGIIAMATVSYASLLVTGHEREMTVLLNLTFAIIFFSGAMATVLCRPLARVLEVLKPISGSGILIAGVNALSSGIAKFAQQYVEVLVLDRNTKACSIASVLGHDTACVDVLDRDVYEEAAEEGFGRLIAMTGNEALNELIAQKAAIHMHPEEIFRVSTGAVSESLIRESSFVTRIAFAKDFLIREAIRDLEAGRARLAVRHPTRIEPASTTPLLELVDNGRGVRILEPGDQPVNEALCFVRAG